MTTRARIVERTATLPLKPDGTIRIVAVSDTHSHPHPKMGERLAELAPDAILHGGDIGDVGVLDELAQAASPAPLFAVRGNIDAQTSAIPDVLLLDLVDDRHADERVALRILLTHIAVYGPKLRADVAKRARTKGATLVVCGHSHVPFIGEDRGIAVFNPGSIGPRRFSLPIVFGTIDVSPSGVRLAHLDCDTGQRWLPP